MSIMNKELMKRGPMIDIIIAKGKKPVEKVEEEVDSQEIMDAILEDIISAVKEGDKQLLHDALMGFINECNMMEEEEVEDEE